MHIEWVFSNMYMYAVAWVCTLIVLTYLVLMVPSVLPCTLVVLTYHVCSGMGYGLLEYMVCSAGVTQSYIIVVWVYYTIYFGLASTCVAKWWGFIKYRVATLKRKGLSLKFSL